MDRRAHHHQGTTLTLGSTAPLGHYRPTASIGDSRTPPFDRFEQSISMRHPDLTCLIARVPGPDFRNAQGQSVANGETVATERVLKGNGPIQKGLAALRHPRGKRRPASAFQTAELLSPRRRATMALKESCSEVLAMALSGQDLLTPFSVQAGVFAFANPAGRGPTARRILVRGVAPRCGKARA